MLDKQVRRLKRRRVLERYLGKPMSDQEWEYQEPDEDESLDSVSQQLRPRFAEYEFELAAASGVGVISESIARDAAVIAKAKAVRRVLFGSTSVPFGSLESAWDWIWQEIDTPEGRENGLVWERYALAIEEATLRLSSFTHRLRAHFEAGAKEPYAITDEDRDLWQQYASALDFGKLNPLVDEVYCKHEHALFQVRRYSAWEVIHLFMQADSRILANIKQRIPDEETRAALTELAQRPGDTKLAAELEKKPLETMADWLQAIGHFGIPGDHVMLTYPGAHVAGENDTSLMACTERLMLLSIFSLDMVQRTTRVWSQGQAAAFILTGAVPKLPRFRVWVDSLPGGGTRTFVELLGSINSREMQQIYSAIRGHSGQARKKSLRPTDVELLDFVDGLHGATWEDKLQQWNRSHERRFKNTSGLINAYSRAAARLTRP